MKILLDYTDSTATVDNGNGGAVVIPLREWDQANVALEEYHPYLEERREVRDRRLIELILIGQRIKAEIEAAQDFEESLHSIIQFPKVAQS